MSHLPGSQVEHIKRCRDRTEASVLAATRDTKEGREALRHHAYNPNLPHVQQVKGDNVVQLLVVGCQAPHGTNSRHEREGTVLHPELVPQKRPWVPVAGERTIQLGVQYGGHVAKRPTDARRSTRHMASDGAVGAEEPTGTAHQAHDRPLGELVGHNAEQPWHSCQRLPSRKLHRDASWACANEPAKEDRETPL